MLRANIAGIDMVGCAVRKQALNGYGKPAVLSFHSSLACSGCGSAFAALGT
jgi:hypothetical protein